MIAPGGIVGNAGGPYKTADGAINIHDADIHHVVILKQFHRLTGVNTTFSAVASVGDRVISVVNAGSFVVGDPLALVGLSEESVFPTIISKSVNDITINQPLDNGYDIGDDVGQVSYNMKVDGSGTPVSFTLHSERGETWHIIQMLLSLVHGTAADDGKFGNVASLQRGVVLRYYNSIAGTFRTLANWKNNADFKLDMTDVVYTDKAAGGEFGTNGVLNFKQSALSLPEIAPGDYLEILVQDDLTTLTSFKLKAQGHIGGG